MSGLSIVKHILLHRRWQVLSLIALLVLLVRIGLLRSSWPEQLNFRFWAELLFPSLTIPLLAGFLLSLLQTQDKISEIVSSQELQKAIRRKLFGIRDWEELKTIFLQIPQALLPLVGVSLFVVDPVSEKYKPAAGWSANDSPLLQPDPAPGSDFCSIFMAMRGETEAVFVPCCCIQDHPAKEHLSHYCLPLIHGSRQVGLFVFFFSPEITLPSKRVELLKELAPDMTMVLDDFRLRHWILDSQAMAKNEERQVIARYLHDTLAHDLAFLRLKLEQLSSNGVDADSAVIRSEMRRMRDIAQQSNERVRQILAQLQEPGTVDFFSALHETAQNIAERAGFEVEIVHTGQKRAIDPQTGREVLYILREVLRNIEKHAQARKVTIVLELNREGLSIEVTDDGQGFEPVFDVVHPENRYGLKMIKDSVAALDGKLEVTSAPGSGSRICFWCPL